MMSRRKCHFSHIGDDVYDDNNNDDVMIRLVEGLNREVTPYLPNVCSQFECVNIKEMHVNRNPSNVDNIFWEPSKELAKGMLFNSREAVKTACKIYSMKVWQQF